MTPRSSNPKPNIGPQVFVSFAGPDLATAQRLIEDLTTRGIRTFLANHDIEPGQNLPARISEGLQQSDFFVLLLSAASIQRAWVQEEWSAAFAREVNTRRAFLFVLRIDETAPPALLAGRRHLDGHRDWEGSVGRLVETWKRDWSAANQHIGVLPAPKPPTSYDPAAIGLFLFNRALDVQHLVRVDPRLTGRQLEAVARNQLALKDRISIMDGKLGLKFQYQIQFQGQPLAPDSPVAELNLKDNDVLDLLVTMEQFGPSIPLQSVVFRSSEDREPWVSDLLLQAFRHLLPW